MYSLNISEASRPGCPELVEGRARPNKLMSKISVGFYEGFQEYFLKLGFLGFFVRDAFLAPLTEFFVLQFSLYLAHVFAGPVIKTFAFGAL